LPGETTGWCSTRADFYRNNYLSFAPTGHAVYSGNWEKWFRAPGTGAWTGPVTTQQLNYFGINCFESPFAWCSEAGLGGIGPWIVLPANTDHCETFLFGPGCGDDTWVLTIRIAPTRVEACGF
jgi:hypothetical protein